MRNATRVVQEAESKAQQIVADAMTRADRIRAESERELAAATQRRDSINAQLANVRQMLATLTGVAPSINDEPSAGHGQMHVHVPSGDGEQGGGSGVDDDRS
jgi:hypothetical protein